MGRDHSCPTCGRGGMNDPVDVLTARLADCEKERDSLRAEVEQYRIAIWSDDSTPNEQGNHEPEDAARFVSGLRAEVGRLKAGLPVMRVTYDPEDVAALRAEVEQYRAAIRLAAKACDCAHLSPVDSMRAAVAYVERLRGIKEAAKQWSKVKRTQQGEAWVAGEILSGRGPFSSARNPAKEK